MIGVAWNCRGLGNPRAVRALKELIKKEDPQIIFLCETKLTKVEWGRMKLKLGFAKCEAVDCEGVGRRGGLALLWRDSVDLSIKAVSSNYVDSWVRHDNGSFWRFTGFYGNFESSRKMESWNKLRDLGEQFNMPWLCCGDFNEILYHSEKRGGVRKASSLLGNFKQALEDCDLFDCEPSGYKYTWSNNQEVLIEARLDRFVVNPEWKLLFPGACFANVEGLSSDHLPIVVYGGGGVVKKRRKKVFRFEAMWLRDPGCEELVKKEWVCREGSNKGESVSNCIKGCSRSLVEWNRFSFGKVRKEIKELEERVQVLGRHKDRGRNRSMLKESKERLHELKEREEIMWRQHSRAIWLKEGDRNTKFFHHTATERRDSNAILGLFNSAGVWMTKDEEMKAVAVSYYRDILSSTAPGRIEEVLNCVEPCVSEDMNEILSQPFCKDEVVLALKQMTPQKAPGPDGLPALFYQRFWGTVGDDISSAVLEVLNGGVMNDEWNQTQITLVPKFKKPKKMTEFRPISLCNVRYKLISKVMVNRLKKVFPDVISQEQSAFLPERLITDNIISAFEMMHAIKSNKKGKMGTMAIKLDMSKAYERVEWSFIEGMLTKLGFCSQWVNLVLKCISTVSYSIMLNGERTDFFYPTRGLRQGDPLSPYLFLICTEGLSALIKKAVCFGELRGVAVCPSAPIVTHLLFADDSLFFCSAEERYCREFARILTVYEESSGQQINMDKSSIFISPNVKEDKRGRLKRGLGISSVMKGEKYLGLPMILGSSKRDFFGGIKERIGKRIAGWKERFLSKAGRETLIKSIAQAIPTFAMSCFSFPKTLLKDIRSMVANFFWGQMKKERKIHWVSWNKLCSSKGRGGIGFRDFALFNSALLAKQGWRVMQNEKSLMARILKARYFPRCNFLEAPVRGNCSFLWRSIASARSLIKEGSQWRVGDGQCIRIWRDKWAEGLGAARLGGGLEDDDKVEKLICRDSGCWKEELIRQNFSLREADTILKTPLCSELPVDRLIWKESSSGLFSVKSAYHLSLKLKENWVEPDQTRKRMWNKLWNAQTTQRAKMFVWRACNRAIPVKMAFRRRGFHVEDSCSLCRTEEESVLHVLRDCPMAFKVWNLLPFGRLLFGPSLADPCSWILYVAWMLDDDEDWNFFIFCLWEIWNQRNSLIRGEKEATPVEIIDFVYRYREEYRSAQGGFLLSGNCVNFHGRSRLRPKWNPPPHGWMKINCDAALDLHSGMAGVGIICRNEAGCVIECAALRKSVVCSVATLEAMAVLDGLKMARRLGAMNVVVESDSEIVIRSLNLKTKDCAPHGHFTEAAVEMAKEFSNISFCFVSRLSNGAAHKLARSCLTTPDCKQWMYCFPEFISDAIHFDVENCILNDH